MIREIFLRDSLLWCFVWQSTIFIVVGLVGSFILRHRSARAHQVLFLAMIAAVIVPVISILVKHYELGLFVAEPVVMQPQAKDWAITSNYGASDIILAEDIEHKPGTIEKDLPSAMAGSESAKFPWRSVVLYGWIAASLILAARLLVTFALGVRLLKRALPLKCEKIKEAVHLAEAKLGIDKDVMVRSSQGVRSPVIWCWRLMPILLVPSAAGRFDNGIDWAGVLCHELAHYKRRDHISGLSAELLVCILPWHPLLWWAKSRLVRLSEQACDDWVVATGQPCTDYAESLLDLTPGGQMAFVPAVVSSRKGLADRVRRILKDSCGNPRTGATWALVVSIVVACFAAGIAFAQTRPAKPQTRPAETKAATEQKPLMVQKLFKLKHHNSSQMAQIVRPLLSNTGHISVDERTNNLLIIDTVGNLKRFEKIIAEFDVSKAGQTVTEIFEIRYGDPAEIVELLKKLINGQPGFGSIIEPGKEPIVLVPEPRRKWIIAKASPENIKQIGEWIKKLDISKSIGMDPADAAVYEQLETIVDLSDLNPGMSFGEVIEMLKNSVEPPLQIQPIWRDLLENAEVERTTPAEMDPLTRVKLRKALEILLAGVSSTELAKLTYIVDEGVILIGTVDMLPPKMEHRVYDISDLVGTADDADNLIRRITTTIEPDSWYKLSETGYGTIMPYPLRQPKKFAVLQTRKIHQQITRFLDDMRSSRDELRKTKPEIQIESRFLMVSEDFLKDIGLDENSVHSSDAWSEHLVAESAAEPNAETYSLILDDLHVSFLLKAVGAHKGAKMLAAPRATIWAGKEAKIAIQSAMHYISGYTEPNRLSDEPEPKHDSFIKGLELQLTPNLTPDDKNILLDVDFKLSEVISFEERKYKGKYPYSIPQTEVVSTKTRRLVPDGKTLLIGGLKITTLFKKEPGAPLLSKLPHLGEAFRSKTGIKEHKILLILIKPAILSKEQAEAMGLDKAGPKKLGAPELGGYGGYGYGAPPGPAGVSVYGRYDPNRPAD